ncbi:MAG: hemerythrin domain-containing protein [Magnetococcales bacterium]|nr:hemerythrin domain-containing protein [Magnetococcales bacterium]
MMEMTTINLLREQHKDILGAITCLADLLEKVGPEGEGEEIRDQLLKIHERALAHFAVEDKLLYPQMAEHKETYLSETAKGFYDVALSLGKELERVCQAWKKGDSSRGDLKEVLEAFQLRIHVEDEFILKKAEESLKGG